MYYNVAIENTANKVRKCYAEGGVGDTKQFSVDYESDKLDETVPLDVRLRVKENDGMLSNAIDALPVVGGTPSKVVCLAVRNRESGEHAYLEIPKPSHDSSDLNTKDWVAAALTPTAHGASRVRRNNPGEAKAMFGEQYMDDDEVSDEYSEAKMKSRAEDRGEMGYE